MSFIHFQCHACQQPLKVGDDKAGKKAKCHKCGTIVTIPLESTHSGPASSGPSSSNLQHPGTGSAKVRKPVPELEELDELDELEEGPSQSARARFTADEDEPPRRRARYEDDDEDRPRRRRDEDEDDRPRRRRDEDDDYDDAPRSRRRDEDDYEEDRPRRRRDDEDERDSEEDRDKRRKSVEKAAWGRAKLGLLLVFIGACVTGGALLLFTIGSILYTIPVVTILTASTRNSSPPGEAWLLLWRIAEPVALLAGVTALVGYVFCMLGPNKKGSMGLSISVLAIAVIYLILDMIFTLPLLYGSTDYMEIDGVRRPLGLVPEGVRAFMVINFKMGQFGTWFPLLLVQLFYSAQLILFPLLLRAFALAKKDRDLAGQCIGVVSVAGIYTGLRLASFIFSYVAMRSGTGRVTEPPYALGWITLILSWLGLLALIGLLIWYIIAVWRGREVVGGR